MKQTSEEAFEDAIEEHLLTKGGYTKGDPDDFDRELALDKTQLIPFIRETQPKQWEYLNKIHGADTEKVLIGDLCKTLESQGWLQL